MTLLPVVDRELRVSARKRATYWGRTSMAAISIGIGTSVFFANFGRPVATTGSAIFLGLSGLAGFWCLLAGARFSVDCLTEEKREGTLGLLFLTDLKGWDVILGKLAATSLNGFFEILAVLPVLAVPLLMGGITSGQFWRIVLVLINIFWFSVSIAIFSSAACRTTQKATSACLGFLFLFTAGIPLTPIVTLKVTSGLYNITQIPFSLFYTSPVFNFASALDVVYRRYPVHFWCSLFVIHGLAWLFVWGAARIVPHSWQDRFSPPAEMTVWGVPRRLRINDQETGKRTAYRKRLLNINAFYWLAARDRFKPARVWVLLAFAFAGYVTGAVIWRRDWFTPPITIGIALSLNFIMKMWISSEAGIRLAEEKKSGAMELLLSTPLTVRDFIRGQWLALRRQFLRPLLAVAAFQLLLLCITNAPSPQDDFPRPFLIIGAGLIMLAADAVALGVVAMHQGLMVRKPPDAGGQTALRILMLPWAALIITGMIINFCCELARQELPSFRFYLALWFGYGLIADLAFGLSARRKLNKRFRALATGRFSSTRSPSA